MIWSAPRVGRVAAAVTAMALTVAGCGGAEDDPGASGPSASADPSGSPSARPDPATLAEFEPFYSQNLDWTSCRSGFQCAKLKVPIDYAKPDGATMKLRLVRLKAVGDSRVGSLLINPGGPGASGVEYAVSAKGKFSSEVRAAYDIVGFDPRGVGSSDPIDCLTDRQLDESIAADATPDTPEEVDVLDEEAQLLADGCEKRSAELLPHVGTFNVARDLDVMRAVLGDKKLNYFGASYGTLIGAVYAELFPTHVGRFVLDGAIDPSLDNDQITTDQTGGFELAYDSFVAACVKLSKCPLGDTKKEVDATITGLLAKIEKKPLPTSTSRKLNESLAMIGILVAMYDEGAWGFLRDALVQALNGDGSTLLVLADIYTEREADGSYKNNASEAIYAVTCLDYPDRASRDEIEKRIPALEKVSPLWGEYIGWSILPCHYWKAPASEPVGKVTAAGAGPIVVIGTTRDPATPYHWAEGLAEQLDSGVLLTYNGDGHTAYGRGSNCIDDAVDTYLLKGKAPKDGKRCG